ncbi:MAG: hypothetical protein HZA66_18405 [Rhodopseudomonas palustris]|uniref:Uncharacterized protein n=1 Tax=Rhodopseudomonas palustris TaxID=1076 RepID=A0A933S1M5_RHOPL|nr:hypothetical protein [Rhodopseudomonas palustris]
MKRAVDLTFAELAEAGAAAAQQAADRAYAAGVTVSGTEQTDGPIVESGGSTDRERSRKKVAGRRR